MFWPLGECLVYSLIKFSSLWIIFPNFFHNVPNAIWITIFLNYRYLLMCVHTSHECYKCLFFMLCRWQWAHGHPWCSSWHFCCNYMRCWFPCEMRTTTCTSFNHVPFLLLMSWHYVHQRWNLQISWRCYNWPNTCGSISLILHNSRIRYFQCGSSQKKRSYCN
jgi:hypothetical protein